MNEIKTNFTASLHTHVRSLNDADISASALAKRVKEMGGKGIAITDHGVMTAIEDFRRVFDVNELKMIPGCELYVQGETGRQHLVVLAANRNGYKGISKLVVEANKHLEGVKLSKEEEVASDKADKNAIPVLPFESLKEIMKDYKGDIIGLSACMVGVISSVFLSNSFIERKIDKIREKQKNYKSAQSEDYLTALKCVREAEARVEDTKSVYNQTRAVAEAKFAKREKEVLKLENANDANAKKYREDLEADKAKTETAKKVLLDRKKDYEDAKRQLSTANKNFAALKISAESYNKYESQIMEMNRYLKTPEDIYAKAKDTMLEYCSIFGNGNFFAELQYHGIKEEAECYPKVLTLAKELNVPIVATNDVHILTKNDDERLKRQILRSMRYGKAFEEESVGDSELYLKDNHELFDALVKIIPEEDAITAINNIDVVFDRCNVEFPEEKHYPKYSKDEDAVSILNKEIEKGIAWRFPEGMDELHKKRLEYEIEIINSMGYTDYFLIVKDFIRYGRNLGYVPADKLAEAPLDNDLLEEYIKKNGWKNKGITIGPGRGSGVGSVACYILGITSLDPLKYDLLFERFLNPERISMPDIDTDFSPAIRGKVIEYVKHRYGEMAVCGILTTTTQAPKGSVQIAAKFYGLRKYGDALTELGKQISKDIPDDPGISFDTIIGAGGENPVILKNYLFDKYKGNQDATEILKWALVMEGAFTAYGAHAAGICISDNGDVSDYIPLRWNTNLNMFSSQCDMVQLEEAGLLKFDFLGLKTLGVLSDCIYDIEKNTGNIIDPLKISLKDKAVYNEIFSKARTTSVFQFESKGMREMLKQFKPDSFEDLIILVSMYRPGPMQYLDDVIAVKNGAKEISFLVPQLKPILNKTYGAIVYQEQVMEICKSLAGFSLGHADQVRRYMSKKKADKLAHEREAFVNGCESNGISPDKANILFDQMMDFAAYAFNKSHAAAYAFVAYLTAWFKYYYPTEFFASALNWEEKNTKYQGLCFEATNLGVKILPPDVNVSEKNFTTQNGTIRFGLSSIAGVKDNADAILKERENGPFRSLVDFYVRTKPDARVIDNLISSGACDSFAKNRTAMKNVISAISDHVSDRNKKMSIIASGNVLVENYEKLHTDEDVVNVQIDNGCKVEFKTLIEKDKISTKIETAEKALDEVNSLLSKIRVVECKEDKKERMILEKKFLGMYITKHPCDYYEIPKDNRLTMINNIDDNTTCIYGVINDIAIKQRKSDGADMAFFTVDDKSGTVDACCFTKAYAKVKTLISEGNVLKFTGKVMVETYTDADGDETVTYKFAVEDVYTLDEKTSTIMISASSYAVFHAFHEDFFRKEYETENGHTLLIYDKALDEVREANYKVSGRVLKDFPSEEVFI